MPPPDEISFIVVGPRRPAHLEQPVAFFPRGRRIGIGIHEDMHMVERADQLDVSGQQHPVAEHVARHVADANHGKIVGLGIDAHFAEMPFDGFQAPRAVIPIFLWS